MEDNILFFLQILFNNQKTQNTTEINDTATERLYEIKKEIDLYNENKEDPYFISENEQVNNLFFDAWEKETNLNLNEAKYYLAGLYVTDNLNRDIFRQLAQKWYLKATIEKRETVFFYILDLIRKEKRTDISSLIYKEYLQFCRFMGIEPVLYSEYKAEILEYLPDYTFSEEEEDFGLYVERLVTNLTERSQYIEEIALGISPDMLYYLDYFIDIDKISDLSYYMQLNLSKEIKLDKKLTMASFQEIIEEKLQQTQFPTVPIVLDPHIKPHIASIDAKEVNIQELMHFPQDQIKNFAMLQAYTCPSLAQNVKIIFIGGPNIGNMGIIIQHNNNAILIDFGMSVANYSLPRWHPSLRYVDAILVTHAHLDHTGGLPYLIRPESNKKWYASVSTKLLTEKLLHNTASIIDSTTKKLDDLPPFYKVYHNRSNIHNVMNSFNQIKPKEKKDITPNISVTAYPSAHLFGSYGYEIEIFDKRILFTGDFSLQNSALFKGAVFPNDCDLTILDGTYYGRERNSADPDSIIQNAVNKHAKLLIPAFSVGRSQEMFKRLDKLGIAKERSIKIAGMSGEIAKLMNIQGDYSIVPTVEPENFVDGDIVISGNGMLQGGTARRLLDATANDQKTGVLLCGYQAPGTLGYALKTAHPIAMDNYLQQVYSAPISGHSTARSLDKFIDTLTGKKVMVHLPEETKKKKKHKNLIIPEYYREIVLDKNIA